MYAVIEKGSHQYKVTAGQFIRIEKMDLPKGAKWNCQNILAIQDQSGQLITGQPFVEKAEVRGLIVTHGKLKKLLVFKKKRRKGYRLTKGHRQEFTEVYIESLKSPNGDSEKKPIVKKTAAKKEKS